MLICIGEILVDMLGIEENGQMKYQRCAGGAPFNVACAAAKTGAESGFVGRAGQDMFGAFLVDYARNAGLFYLDIEQDADANTTLALVQLDSSGERSFCFIRKHTADYRITKEQAEKAVAKADTVHLGTLMLSEKEGIELADYVIAAAKKHKKRLSIDINYREDIFRQKDAVSVYRKYVNAADIVKYSEEELSMFYGEGNFEERLKAASAGKQLVCVTLGKNGSAYCVNGKVYYADSVRVEPVDTTGAGDAFFGCLLGSIDGREIADIPAEELNKIVRRANICGALTTPKRGAIDASPDKKSLDYFFEN